MLRRSWLAMPVLVSGLLGACAIGGDDSRTDAPGTQIPDPPQGGSAGAGGTFDPGSGGLPGSGASYGAGASSNMAGTDSGQGGQGGDPGPPPPPECTDDLKRCPACHGRVLIMGTYGSLRRLAMAHRRGHDGCPLRPLHFQGVATRHPEPIE